MRVLNIMLDKGWGGTEQMALSYGHALSGKHEVIYAADPQSDLRTRLAAEGVTPLVARYPAVRVDVRTVFQLAGALRASKPDVILAHNSLTALNAYAARLLSGHDAPLVRIHHTEVRPRQFNRADLNIAVTFAVAAQARGFGVPQNRLLTLHNFIEASALPLREKTLKGPLKIGFLGRVTQAKGADTFIQAVHHLAGAGCDVRGVIGGTGPDEAPYRAMADAGAAKGRFDWRGWVSDKDAFFNDIDVLILPSVREAFGLVILEAWAHGVPVVATRTAGPSELIRHGENGMLAGFDGADVARQVAALAASSAFYEAVRQQAHADFGHYSMDRQGAELARVLEGVCTTRADASIRPAAGLRPTR